MLSKLFRQHPFRLFYVVFIYIITFSVWWAYLLYSKNQAAYNELIELESIQHQISGSAEPFTATATYTELQSKYNRQKWMILLEGTVFIGLLLLGLAQVRKTFARELELAKQQRNFLLSITHELKSPVATIKLSLQTLKQRQLDAEQTQRVLNNSMNDAERLDALVNNILYAAKIESKHHEFHDTDVNVSELVSSIAKRMDMNKGDIKISSEIQADIIATTDQIGFTSVVINLIENAIKYSERGSTVLVRLHSEGNTFYFTVADNGIGIPVSERLKIFEKFYRVGNEDTRKTKGTGLGLYIVKRFVEIYHGEIEVKDNLPKGTSITIKLPLQHTAQ